ncbi:hypothetical protein RFI_31194 [Reticulomyxa filosa]|uniref:Purple acid phosphatase n=1 Tax=Reticulomyxa filosa TaxID=46433 RepID=X6LYF8_RETFI|nr:hypothetical protein RFI_31194 [Reticulomyxa filosa]|eukprot:ETO06202.1 hypothetical protein RFI_31194 [Reticulomyxa filosa]
MFPLLARKNFLSFPNNKMALCTGLKKIKYALTFCLICAIYFCTVEPKTNVKLEQSQEIPSFLWRVDSKNSKLWDSKLRLASKSFRVAPKINAEGGVQLTVYPSQLETPNGSGVVTLEWQNVSSPTTQDWIGTPKKNKIRIRIYCPANSSNEDYIDYVWTNGIPDGSMNVTLWNMRDDYELRYFSDKDGNEYWLRATSNVVTVNKYQPLQGHLSLTENGCSEMRMMWVSSNVDEFVPRVRVGAQNGVYTAEYVAKGHTYNTSQMCYSGASIISPQWYRDPGTIYDALLTNLTCNTMYYFIFGSDKEWSQQSTFITASNDPDDTFEFVMYGDMGISPPPGGVTTAANLAQYEPNLRLILHVGDLSYALGHGYIWEQWSNLVTPIASKVPYMVSVGNHEYDHLQNSSSKDNEDISGAANNGYHPDWGNFGDDSNGECGVPTAERYHMPDNGNQVFWYSFDFQSVHFVMLSSEHNLSQGSEAYQWLKQDLQMADAQRDRFPWIIVNLHRPLYVSESYPSDLQVAEHLKLELETLLYEFGVDVVFSGHFHAYQRTCAVYHDQCIGEKNGGITHIMIGTAGKTLDDQHFLPMQWNEFNDIQFGYGKIFVNSSTLLFQFLRNSDRAVVDSVTLYKYDSVQKTFFIYTLYKKKIFFLIKNFDTG